MATKKKGERTKEGRFLRLHHFMMQTKAWRSLNATERAIYIELAARYAGMNNGRIAYSVREAVEALRIGKSTAARALITLQVRGFIATMKKGYFNARAKRTATEWRLTDYACDVSGINPSREYAQWGKHDDLVPSQTLGVPEVGPLVPEVGPALTEYPVLVSQVGPKAPDATSSQCHHRYTSNLPVESDFVANTTRKPSNAFVPLSAQAAQVADCEIHAPPAFSDAKGPTSGSCRS